jgi:hypothetical protein
MKKGTPSSEVTMPTGISAGINTNLAKVSEQRSKQEPTTALHGSKNLWSLPISILAICGEIKQTKPMTPVKAIMLAVANVANTIHVASARLELTPRLVATSSARALTTFEFRSGAHGYAKTPGMSVPKNIWFISAFMAAGSISEKSSG